MKTVNREEFLKILNLVSPGLSTRDIIEQSSCFVIKNRTITTFNDEVACRMPCDIFDDEEAAIPSKILSHIAKLPDETIGLELTDSEIIIKGKGRKSGFRIEREVLLPVDHIEKPKEWKKLPDDFCDAVETVQLCASRDESVMVYTCVNITPDMIQARDNAQGCRWKMNTGFSVPCLVRQNAIKHVANLGVTQFSESESWLHFKNGSSLIFSCRQWKDEYPSQKLIFGTKDHAGNPIKFSKGVLPKSLADACERADEFSSDNSEKEFNRILIELRPGHLKLRGEGSFNWCEEKKKIKYDGPTMSFMINPKLLGQIVKKHTEVDLASDRMRINGGNYIYVTGLSQPQQEETNEKEED